MTNSDFDPFAGDETPAKTTKKEASVSEETNTQAGGITISHKPSNAYDSALLVIKGGSPTEALATYQDPNMKPLIEMASKVDVFVKETFAKDGPAPADAPAKAPSTEARKEAPGGEKRTCQHGQMQYKTGISKKDGKTWQGFFCPTPQGTADQCKPQFLR